MKKAILVFLTLFVAMNAFADGKSDALLGALARKVASWGDYRVEFGVDIDGQSLNGSYEVSGDRYLVYTPDIVLLCDGTTKWEVNLPLQEVVIDSVDPSDLTVLANPTRLFDFLDGNYTHRYVGTALIDGVSCERIEVVENEVGPGNGDDFGSMSGGTESQKIDVYISASTGLPVRLDYNMALLNTSATIDVVRITPNISLENSAFVFDAARYPDFEIIDFR